jgi:hypothetical protein
MPKFPTFPIIYDSTLQINISDLKKWGYLNPGIIKSGVLSWSSRGTKTGSISIESNTTDEHPYIELTYKFEETPRKYKVFLTSTPSNLNKGVLWFFICPWTGKHCRKLYSVNGYFLHREAFNGCMYDCQTQSKYYRYLDKNFGAYFDLDKQHEKLNKKHFKKTYAGKPTKKYLRIKEQINKGRAIPIDRIELLMIFGK